MVRGNSFCVKKTYVFCVIYAMIGKPKKDKGQGGIK